MCAEHRQQAIPWSSSSARRVENVRLVKAAEPLIPGGYRASLFARNRRRSRPRITPRQRCHPGRAGADQRDLACPRRRTSIVSPRAITIVSIPLRNSPCSTTSGIAAKRAKTASPSMPRGGSAGFARPPSREDHSHESTSAPLWRTEARSSTRDAASRTASFSRNCPGAAEIAGKPPAVCSATPGVVMKKVSVIR